MQKIILTLCISLLLASPAFAGLNVVATLPWIGSLAKEIGKDKVSVTTLVKPTQDPHAVEAKPSMILAGRKADIIMYNGLDLEIGYLPLIMESSKNPKIMPGRPGNFDCSKFVKVIDKHAHVERSMGDVHPLGNPHYHYSPSNIIRIVEGMTNALAKMDPDNATFYRSNYKIFSASFGERVKKWKAQSQHLAGNRYTAYHKLFEYLAAEYGFKIVAYVEPKPGIPPSAAYIEGLIERMKAIRPDGILTTSFYGKRESENIALKTGVKVVTLPADVGSMPGTDDWFSFMDKVIASLK
jgi:zinc/manganese transport system substrate-binding protein